MMRSTDYTSVFKRMESGSDLGYEMIQRQRIKLDMLKSNQMQKFQNLKGEEQQESGEKTNHS